MFQSEPIKIYRERQTGTWGESDLYHALNMIIVPRLFQNIGVDRLKLNKLKALLTGEL